MKNKQTIFWICLFVLPLMVLTILVFKNKSKQQYTTFSRAELQMKFKKFSDKWGALTFVPIARTAEFDKGIKSIPIMPPGILDPNQLSQMRKSLYNLIFAFHDGTYESYHKFRVPVPDFEVAKSVRGSMEESGKTVPQDSEGFLKLYWDTYCVNVWTNYWKELNIDHSSVQLQRLTEISTNSNVSLMEYVESKDNMGVSQMGPMLRFNETASTILAKQGFVLYATACIVPKGDGATFPVYCRYYWSQEENKWLPEGLAEAYEGPRKLQLLF